MKINKRLKLIVIFIAVLLSTTGLFLYFDKGLNGLFVNWFSDSFMSTTMGKDASSGRDVLIYEPFWPELKKFLLTLLVTANLGILILVYVVARKVREKEKKITVNEISKYMDAYLNHANTSVWKKDYTEIENQLLKVNESNSQFRELLQKELQQKKDLITYLAHDLKNPLAAIIGYLDLVNENPDLSDADRRRCLKITLEKAERLELLIEEFFDITRFEIQDIVLNIQDVDLGFLLSQVTDSFYPIMEKEEKNIVFEIENSIKIKGDPDKLARVFANLIKNSIAYSFPKTDIVIKANQTISHAIIQIINDGEELSKEQLENIFTKFYRLDTSRSTQTGGAGLGLSIAKNIILAHHGEISAISNNGKIIFSVTLPLKA